jgi:hypothetical protein
MKSFKEFLEEDEWEESHSETLSIRVVGRTDRRAELLLESAYELIEEGRWAPAASGHEIRLDRRPENQGGDQLHIRKKNQQWAYRHNGRKSEPRKYKHPPTNAVKDIVKNVFGIDRELIEEVRVTSADEDFLCVEVVITGLDGNI